MQQKFETYATACGVMVEIPFNMNQSVNANVLWNLKYIMQKMWLILLKQTHIQTGEYKSNINKNALIKKA